MLSFGMVFDICSVQKSTSLETILYFSLHDKFKARLLQLTSYCVYLPEFVTDKQL